ncbi:MAG: sarcosine oxidase subunit delta, partial [Pseudomonadota bacterium]
AWAEHLFYRANGKGVVAERWQHRHGCQRWFNALRDTASDRILETYPAGAPRPDLTTGAGE